MNPGLRALAPYSILAVLCLLSPALRPVLSPDETRYFSVAWEMWQNGNWFVPTMNFAAYDDKPPLLFWLIDLSWLVFGVGRFGASVVVFAVASLVVWLTGRLARALLPERPDIQARLPWLMVGNAVFLIYAGLILFDLLLTACVLVAVLGFLTLARGETRKGVLLVGLGLGFGILAKGPATLIHAVWPLLLYPLWRGERETLSTARLWRGAGLALLVALAVVALWLVPALTASDGRFAKELIWDQSAGRISGRMAASHPRPVYFYLMLLPIIGLPWLFLPQFWRALATLRRRVAGAAEGDGEGRVLRLLLLWPLGILVVFSLISGKQPHYILPIVAPLTILFAWMLAALPPRSLVWRAYATGGVLMAAQVVAAFTAYPLLELQPVADLLARERDRPMAFAGNYAAEFGFLGRLTRPLDTIDDDAAPAWAKAHPGGIVVSYDDSVAAAATGTLLTRPYRDDHVYVLSAEQLGATPGG
ncbi:hypothetical protein GCM10011390_30040 [Aureimonas endophytica]|uniref:Glycosyltransferase RgtA/B/C/D-like domain-containing protein n=1 Tax=Aureimonas endophytica TaxID=2027858 RepID=A0A916ZQ96_9HYPH|nr:glycosyltransferase family 39 protein [Aureimonas endophytica]GGE08973.1 hypothetical protein GCM10011390_30040 [Aureimonas endophytica]